MSTVCESHVRLDDRGVAWVDDSNTKVIEIALEHIAHGSSPEEIWEQHQGYSTMAQIHAALSHYYDHQADYDAEIDRQMRDFARYAQRLITRPAGDGCAARKSSREHLALHGRARTAGGDSRPAKSTALKCRPAKG